MFIECLQRCRFLFQNKLIKKMIEIGDSFKSKIKVLESIFFKVNIHNYEYLRMLSWHISKYYYKKAIEDET